MTNSQNSQILSKQCRLIYLRYKQSSEKYNKYRICHPKVSKTRGEPSTSTNLKEALCEKIPVHHDLLRNFRFYFGSNVVSQITVENLYTGLNDVKTIVKETSELDPKHGVIIIIKCLIIKRQDIFKLLKE